MLPVLTTLTAPLHANLTQLLTVKAELNVDYDAHDTVLDRYIREASTTIVRMTRQPWARARYREFLQACGPQLWVRYTPIVAVEALAWVDRTANTSEVVTPYDLMGTDGLSVRSSWTRSGWASAYPGETGYQVDYAAGYLVPDDDYTASTLTFDALTNTITDSAGGFPLLAGGDTVTLSGTNEAANSGTATVVSRTASTLEVAGLALVDEAEGAEVTLTVRTLPEHVEWACLELVKSKYLARQFSLTGPRVIDGPGGTQVQDDLGGDIPKIVWRLLRMEREVYV